MVRQTSLSEWLKTKRLGIRPCAYYSATNYVQIYSWYGRTRAYCVVNSIIVLTQMTWTQKSVARFGGTLIQAQIRSGAPLSLQLLHKLPVKIQIKTNPKILLNTVSPSRFVLQSSRSFYKHISSLTRVTGKVIWCPGTAPPGATSHMQTGDCSNGTHWDGAQGMFGWKTSHAYGHSV